MKLVNKQSVLQQIYNGCERCLIAPENPFTLDNPDLLAANGNKLFAVYLLSYREHENLDHLLRRLYLSQLSYGYKMTPVLLFLNDEPHNMQVNHKVLKYVFSHVSDSVDDVVKYIAIEKPNYKRWKNFTEVQSSQFLNYRACMELSEKSFEENQGAKKIEEGLENITFSGPVNTRSWYYDKWKESKSYWRTQKGLVGKVLKSQNTSFKTSMDYLMTTAFMTLFNFDNGVIYPSGYHNELSVVNTNWNVFNEDRTPNRYNRMLSFIGLAPVNISSNQDIDWLYDNYQTIRHHVIG